VAGHKYWTVGGELNTRREAQSHLNTGSRSRTDPGDRRRTNTGDR